MTRAACGDLLPLCQQALEALLDTPAQQCQAAATAELAQQLVVRVHRRGVRDPLQIQSMARNFLADGQTVRAMLDCADPAHEQRWEQAHRTAVRWLYARGLYPCDETMLDERAPDVAVLGDLKRALPEFDYACQLETFIIALTQRRAQRWLRDREASKRGGSGIFSRARRRQQQEQGQRTLRLRDQVRYLSQLIAQEGEALEEQIGGATDIAALAEEHALLELVVAEARAQAAEEGSELILKLWYAVFIEGRSCRQLAARYQRPPAEITALVRRFKTRLQVSLRSWLAREGE